MSKFNIGEDTSVTKTKSNSKNDLKYCRSCGFENMKNSKFCSECGNSSFYDTLEEYEDARNSKYCVHCKSKVSVKMKFCTNCGKNEFVSTKEELGLADENRINSLWKSKIKEQDDKLRSIEHTNDKLRKEISSLNFEYKEKVDRFRKLKEDAAKYSEESSIYYNGEQKKKLAELEYFEEKLKKLQKDNDLIINDNDVKLRDLNKKIADLDAKSKAVENEIASLKNKDNKKDNYFDLSTDQLLEAFGIKSPASNNTVENFKKTDKSHIYFGKYNGKPILWNIVDENKNEMLLISNECLDAVTRIGNHMDNWLDNFYKNVLTADEKKYLSIVPQSNGKYVSLLTHDQVVKHMFYKEKRLCGYNDIAGKKANLRNGLISWWLKGIEIVNGKGDINSTVCSSSIHGIRPVILLIKKK